MLIATKTCIAVTTPTPSLFAVPRKTSLAATIFVVSDQSGFHHLNKRLSGRLALRKNVNNLSFEERRELGGALGNMKALGDNDWRSYARVANYHGGPFMCDPDWWDIFSSVYCHSNLSSVTALLIAEL